jgi:UDP-GlcNAc:undecaprenyl-phosphate GlcNAc-1-phosphate transferase
MDEIEVGALAYLAVLNFFCLLSLQAFAVSFSRCLMKKNFLGRSIPIIGGLTFLIGAVCTIPLVNIWLTGFAGSDDEPGVYVLNAWVLSVLGFAVLGLIDDIWGSRDVGGFKGHFQSLIVKRRITTGLLKAVGGGGLALVSGYELSLDMRSVHGYQPIYLLTCVYGLLIALLANSLNLIDVRPGRTLSTAIILSLAIIGTEFGRFASPFLLVAFIPIYIYDRAGKIMLGDCGSNAIGAAIGVAYILALPFWGVCIGVVLLAAFNIWCEKHSVNKLIEDTPWLRSIDRKIGVR